jgi:hypothetical protein
MSASLVIRARNAGGREGNVRMVCVLNGGGVEPGTTTLLEQDLHLWEVVCLTARSASIHHASL